MTNKDKARHLLFKSGFEIKGRDDEQFAALDELTHLFNKADELSKWETVHATESLDGLAKVIESFANEEGKIAGTGKWYDAKEMAQHCRNVAGINPFASLRCLTRHYGIRKQALYLIQ